MDGVTIEEIIKARDNARMCITYIGGMRLLLNTYLTGNISELHRESFADHWRTILTEQRRWTSALIESYHRGVETIELARVARDKPASGNRSTVLGTILLDVDADCRDYVSRHPDKPSWAQFDEPIRLESSLEEWRDKTFKYLAYLSAYKPPADLILLVKEIREEAALTIHYLRTKGIVQCAVAVTPVGESKREAPKYWPDLTILVSDDDDLLVIREKGLKESRRDAQSLGLTPALLQTLHGLAACAGNMTIIGALGNQARKRLSRLNRALMHAFPGYQEHAIEEGKARFKIEKRQSKHETEIERLVRESKEDDDGSSLRR